MSGVRPVVDGYRSPGRHAPAGTAADHRADETWREQSILYLDGLPAGDVEAGLLYADFVLSLAALDPWWYGPATIVVPFAYGQARSYLAPYMTVGPDHGLGGVQTVTIDGDTDAWGTWELTGPCAGGTIGIVGGAHFGFTATIAAGSTITVDARAGTVVDETGANRIGDLAWPESTLFTIPPGPQLLNVTLNGPGGGASVTLSYRPRYESS